MKISNTANVLTQALLENQRLIQAGENPNKMITPYLTGAPGIGKTSIVEQTGAEMGLEVQSVIIAQFDPAELAGLAYLDGDQYNRARPSWMPEDGEGILFLDELPQACTMSQNLMAQLCNERKIGEHALGDGWLLVAAGNSTKHKAGTSTMPTHLRDRLMFLECQANLDDVVEYFNKAGYDERICGYLRYRPDFLAQFDPSQDACPSPRSWARVSTILQWTLSPFEQYESVKGTVGEAAAADLQGYLELYHEMPDPDKIIANPEKGEIPTNPALLYALTSALAARSKKENIKKIITYLNRLTNREFAAFTMKDALARNPEFLNNSDVQAWFLKEGKELLR